MTWLQLSVAGPVSGVSATSASAAVSATCSATSACGLLGDLGDDLGRAPASAATPLPRRRRLPRRPEALAAARRASRSAWAWAAASRAAACSGGELGLFLGAALGDRGPGRVALVGDEAALFDGVGDHAGEQAVRADRVVVAGIGYWTTSGSTLVSTTATTGCRACWPR
jgi:hypothetical protein